MQYQSECRNALELIINISKSFQKVFMDAIKLFIAIPDRINSCKWDDMDVSRNRHTETILRMMTLTGFSSMKPSSGNTLKVVVKR